MIMSFSVLEIFFKVTSIQIQLTQINLIGIQNSVFMKNLADRLCLLIAQARSYSLTSMERRQKFTEIYRLTTKSRKLWRENTPYYEDALQEMWEYCYRHLEEYDPSVKGVITWLDDE